MRLVRLIYTSKIAPIFTPDDLAKIEDASVRRNKADGISGVLDFNRKYFLQVLEGSRTAVNATYVRIARDERHHEVTLLDYCPIDQRSFTPWSMKFLSESNHTRGIVHEFSASDVFEPYALGPDAAHKFLQALVERTPV